MADQYGAPFGVYTLTGQGLTGPQKTAINLSIGGFSALFSGNTAPAPATGSTPLPHPDFDKIPPVVRRLILDEITALQAAITAST